ncbi:MAG TPA: hypothetical protein VLA31_04185 [Burkholderiaceae bacterium]|nr:hypothetical protein [Burkholderiaceae bacterium]
MVKLTNSKGKLNAGLASSAILGAAIPIIVTAATGGLAAVPIAMWVGLGSVVSGLLAGNVEVKSKTQRVLEAEEKKAGRGE